MEKAIVDLTPKWEDMIPIFCAILEDGSFEGKQYAREELTRIAKFVDKMNDKE